MRPDPRPVQPSTVLALSRTLRAGSAGAAAFAAASLTGAARGALPEGRSGRRDGRFRSNKGMLLIDLNEPHHPHHDQLLNLTHTTPDLGIALAQRATVLPVRAARLSIFMMEAIGETCRPKGHVWTLIPVVVLMFAR